jgi:hypothetical protein
LLSLVPLSYIKHAALLPSYQAFSPFLKPDRWEAGSWVPQLADSKGTDLRSMKHQLLARPPAPDRYIAPQEVPRPQHWPKCATNRDTLPFKKHIINHYLSDHTIFSYNGKRRRTTARTTASSSHRLSCPPMLIGLNRLPETIPPYDTEPLRLFQLTLHQAKQKSSSRDQSSPRDQSPKAAVLCPFGCGGAHEA